MRSIRWLAVLPFLGLIVGPFFVNRAMPLVFGLPFLLAWIVGWILLTSLIMAVIYSFDPANRDCKPFFIAVAALLALGVGFLARMILAIVVFLVLYLPYRYYGGLAPMFAAIEQAKPGFTTLPAHGESVWWFSSTVLLTALGFYMWPHTFGSISRRRAQR